jgi:two-component system NtrC family response regulator
MVFLLDYRDSDEYRRMDPPSGNLHPREKRTSLYPAMEPSRILIVDDDAPQRKVLAGYLKKQKHTVFEAGSAADALSRFRTDDIDIVLTDLKMPGESGHELLLKTRSLSPETAVVLMTAFGTIEGAVDAMRAGAYDYLTKPIELDELDLLIGRISERRRLISENRTLKEQLAEKFSFEGIVSESDSMQEVLNTAGRVAQSKASILVRGESGTGKELLARAMHFSSPRKDRPFVAVNCAALNENLLESELFGHERGAFTGAEKQRKGRFELADTGTLFLDEVGDLPAATQVKLLRVLQEESFERVGGSEAINVDVRVLAATNRNLEELIRQGTFREDLFYRLNVVSIDIPPLRLRREDIAPSIEHFATRYGKEQRRRKISFTKDAWNALLRYDYPGNVRELENIVQRAVILARGDTISLAELPQVVKGLKNDDTPAAPAAARDLPGAVEKLEKDLVFESLRVNGGNQSKAARDLGISERNLRYRLKKWGVRESPMGGQRPTRKKRSA